MNVQPRRIDVMITSFDTTATPAQIALELATVAERLHRSTVQVRSRRYGGGSGVIWNSDGLIITNAHVVPREHATVELSDGRVFEAKVTAQDPQQDLAALRVEATDLPAATLGNSDALRVGELVLAVGNPLGLVGALTTGIIHAASPTNSPKWGTKMTAAYSPAPTPQKWVMADVQLAPGNSGGPLADAQGQVIGINTMIVGGLALAVPSNAVQRFLSGNRRPYLGVTLRPVSVLLENKRILGLLVLDVAFGSLAMAANLQIGDVLMGVLGQCFNSPDDLASVLWHAEPGDLLPLEFLRNGKRYEQTVMVGGSKDVAANIVSEVKSA
jgi:serine protease Do